MQKAICRDGANLVKTRLVITLEGITKVLQLYKAVLADSERGSELNFFEERLHKCLRNDGLQSFLRLLQEYLQSKSINIDEAIPQKIHILSSAYGSSNTVLLLNNKISFVRVIIAESEQRFLHCIVEADT